LIKARVRDVQAYDDLYQRLISRIELADVSASFVMEELKDTTELPLP
jgi:Lrp/AsnC family transcriptional regulator